MEPQPPLHHNNAENRKALTYRVRGIPSSVDISDLRKGLEVLLETQDLQVDSLAPSSIRRQGQVATIRVANSEKLPDTRDEWRIPAGRTLVVQRDDKSEPMLAIDTHFRGFTPLYSPASDTDHSLDCIAISGLGSHAFGSWKDRDSPYMWLRDALQHDLPGTRVLTYGYDTRLAESNSFQNLEDVALTFRACLRIALGSRPPDRPLIFIAHSLDGLVLKQALIQMASEDGVYRRMFQSTYGILFFGVPNQGMDISSLLAMVGSQPNLPFLTMLSKDSGSLQGLVERFRTVFDFEDSEIVSLYETCASRTAVKDTKGKWSMSGDYALLVDRYSARSGRSWEESSEFLQSIDRNHSDMVKFSEYDDIGGIVGDFLIRFAKAAPAVIEERLKSLEDSTTSVLLNLRPLAFRSQSLGEEVETKELEKPVEALYGTNKRGKGTGQRSKGKEGPNERRHDGGSKAGAEKPKRPTSSGPSVRENKDALKVFGDADFDIEVRSSRNAGLTWAARKGHVSLVEQLLNRHAPLEHKDKEGWTLLHWAAFTANLELFNLLLSRGADSGARTYDGDSMLHIVSSFGIDHIKRETNDYCGSSLNRKAIGLVLLDKGLPVDLTNLQGRTPLLCAAAFGLESMVVVLASREAFLNFGDRDACTPLRLAARNGHIGVVRLLVERQPISIWIADFLFAAFNDEESAMRTFLDAGVMVDTTDGQ